MQILLAIIMIVCACFVLFIELNLARGILGRRRPQPGLRRGAALVRLRHGRSPPRQQQRVNLLDEATGALLRKPTGRRRSVLPTRSRCEHCMST
jgi:hypothetical protein